MPSRTVGCTRKRTHVPFAEDMPMDLRNPETTIDTAPTQE